MWDAPGPDLEIRKWRRQSLGDNTGHNIYIYNIYIKIKDVFNQPLGIWCSVQKWGQLQWDHKSDADAFN